ncbi:Cell surface lipoprotein [Methanosarcina siciliae T4/M]|uniref:Cell surface lipoprotein n=2 Tax=Methanosarcina siciliae TaxID=38027 RepID=A0A0E3PHJ2_9EURY|nr:cell surface lipoprotein [Methanosarcina siciliae]AKB30394.1 Cell surface lipoprotein [Methanosarcina siciliae T4/M]AKB34312.1 Cell surface lipoprotein [Methanosarcina siciliae HI350]
MKGKILVLFLVFVFLFASGCAEEDAGSGTEDSAASEAVVTESQENVPTENVVSDGKEHIVRLEYYNVTRPSELDVLAGDTVSWWSGKRQGTYVLVSEDGLFPDQEMAYSVPYSYTFNTPGTYIFSVKDVPEMNVTIRVS